MVEYDRNQLQAAPGSTGLKICIVGVGGSGSNVLDRITLDKTVEANLISMHTDVRVLGHSMAPLKLQLGGELMRGVGAGGDPDLGREAALFSRDAIRTALQGFNIIFICTGLGGGTGSGAAPVIAEIAKSTGALVLVVATMPFSFEGRRRINQAEEALELLQKRADALILFENNRMGELILPKDGIQKAFSQADQLIAQSLRAVSTMVSIPGLVKLGLDDLTTALSASNGRCLFGFGEARGQNRGAEALKRALKSPLIDQGRLLHQTRSLLVHVAGGESLTLMEVEAIMKQLGRNVPDHTHILFGVAVDAKLGESTSVTLISSLGLEQLTAHTTAPAAPVALIAPPPVRAEPRPAPTPITAPPQLAPIAEPEPMELFSPEELPPVIPAPPSVVHAEPVAEIEEPPAAIKEEEPEEEFIAAVEAPAIRFEAAEEEQEEEEEASATIPDSVDIADEPIFEEVADEEDVEEEDVPFIPDTPQVLAPVADTAHVPLPAVSRPVAAEEPAPVPATAPAAPAKQHGSTLAAVVARGNGNGSKRATEDQATFRLGDEDRGKHFKDTEPALASDGGENLDVPTWMRLKRKIRG